MAVVLISGCSSGFGSEFAVRFAEEGHVVYAGVRDLSRVPVVSRGDVRPVLLDVTSEASVGAAVDRVRAEVGRVDVLVNNAGIWLTGPVEETSPTLMATLFDVNVLGPVRLLQAVLPMMRAQGSGALVTISSMNGVVPMPQSVAYCASKFALEAIAEGLVYELAGSGVRSVIIEPGVFNTGLHARSIAVGDGGAAMAAMASELSTAAPSLTVVADAVYHAAFDAATPLRVPVGPDAEMLIEARASMSADEFVTYLGGLFAS